MTADWVAAAVRARALARRRLGRLGAQRLARLDSLAAAVAALASTPYSRDVRPDMDLRAAGRAIFSTLLWHLRILAGWAPPRGADRVRLLAAGFEIANIIGLVARLTGRPTLADFETGSGRLSWSSARTVTGVRVALAVSVWGDPAAEDLGTMRMALEAAWARRVADGVPEARDWAASFAALVAARALAAGVPLGLDSPAGRNLRSVLGGRWVTAQTVGELADRLPRSIDWLLADIESGDDLWRAEARLWTRVEADGFRLATGPPLGPASVVGVAALLGADAWRTRAALEVAARSGNLGSAELFDAVA